MRTNIDIEDWLWERSRKYAERRRYSLAYVVNLALRDFLGIRRSIEPKRPGRPRRVETDPRGGRK